MKLKYNLQFFAAAGRVCTGFSKPYVGKYTASAGVISYTNTRKLARGVSVSMTPDSGSDNDFYADNQLAESESGVFTSGTATLTVDGLLFAAEKMVMGLPDAGQDGWTGYGDGQNIPNVGIGFIARYRSDGAEIFVPIVLVKAKFNQVPISAQTQGESIDWQTEELSAKVMRGDDANHTWKWIGADCETEAAAESALKTKMNYVTPTYTVTFDSNGGSSVTAEVVTEGNLVTKPTDPTKTDNTFAGWYSDEELTTAFDFTSTYITASITLYAKWTTGA